LAVRRGGIGSAQRGQQAHARTGNDAHMRGDLDHPRQSGLNHFGISVVDLDTSVAFYCNVLGAVLVVPPRDGQSLSSSWRYAVVRLGPLMVDIYQHSGNAGERFAPARTGLDHLGLVAETHDDLMACSSWLDAQVVERSEIRDVAVGEIFDFSDPDGIQLEFFFMDQERLARSALYTALN
jgi:glyoxylase I family protein